MPAAVGSQCAGQRGRAAGESLPRAPFEVSLAFAIEGANIVNDVLGRFDDHPDTLTGFGDELGRAQKFLQLSRAGLAGSGASQGLLAFVDRVGPLLETVLSLTQERNVH